jgi:hypothetical protein
MKTITKIIYPALLALGVACFAVSPTAQAQLPSPAPDGGYPNGNTAEGDGALSSVTTGGNNTANGNNALNSNTTGSNNTATGVYALFSNTTGNFNTATGNNALSSNTTGFNNTATGVGALFGNTTGTYNTANGFGALENNTTGRLNTATGVGALEFNTTGNFNTATGNNALFSNRTGENNIALGFDAGESLTGSNNIDIGNIGVAGESNTIRIGNEVAFTDGAGIIHPAQTNAYIAGINGVDKSSGAPVFIDANGQLGTGSASPPGSVVMLPAASGVAPPAPAGYSFKGFVLLATKANGGGMTTSYAVVHEELTGRSRVGHI